MSIDMTEVRQLFFEESFESLDTMESNLLDLQVGDADKDLINSIFRVVHSIKGGAGIFKFESMVGFAHTAETLLDEIRSGEHSVTQAMIDVLLQTVDVLRMMLTQLQASEPYDESSVNTCLISLRGFLKTHETDTTTAPSAVVSAAPVFEKKSTQYWKIIFKPDESLLKTGNDPINLFNELALLGTLTVEAELDHLPTWQELVVQNCYLNWVLMLEGNVQRQHIEEIFEWVEGDCELTIIDLSAELVSNDAPTVEIAAESALESSSVESVTPPTVASEPIEAQGAIHSELSAAVSEVVDCAPETLEVSEVPDTFTPEESLEIPRNFEVSESVTPEETTAFTSEMDISVTKPVDKAPPTPKIDKAEVEDALGLKNQATLNGTSAHLSATNTPSSEASSIRVSIDKIDDLINIVGELVITQSMLDQVSENFDFVKLAQLRDGLTQLERNTRELQKSVMRIRMLPISYSFNRFPRLVHDLSVSLGKKVELKMSGEHTELDKTVLEKMSDPLVHLVRNALDHGIEKPAERLAAGKPEKGLLHLHAFHQGGNIMIQISDDGAGFDMKRIHEKAISSGLLNPDDPVTDEQLYEFIFHPGFSTASQISDLSGRGVGMDVVRRNIRSLGGSIDIRSIPGKGTTFNIRLPLTLAILDGQLVRVGEEIYILSLLSIIESLRVNSEQVNSLAGKAEVYKLRDDYIPVLRLYSLFNIPNAVTRLEEGLLVIIEGDGQRIGLFVDELLSQQQIVIKSLETNYKSVAGISGATILGDGSVALILDVAGLIKLSQTSVPIMRRLAKEREHEYQH
ncbi:chemotaxis protein CheA [Thioflexithrix psekupsensis]|uniref:chemotaxis protein CheA n=1 Tax=Thioflexithrix psekupsensis TaxID=1570016 RepID=UPI0015933E48|nr:chemotaxis protein CheA [Thioflexithrix psekupsensis]